MKQLAFITVLGFILLIFSCGNKQSTNGNNENGSADSTSLPVSDAIHSISSRIQSEPENSSLRYDRAEIWFREGNYPAAIEDLNIAILKDSLNLKYYNLLAESHLQNLDSKKALSSLELALKIDSTDLPTLSSLANFQMILKQHKQSIETIAKILEQDPRHPDAYYLLGMNFRETGDTARAVNSFQTAVEQDPYHIDAYRNLALLFDKKNNPIALKYFDNILRIDSTDYSALMGKAWYYHQRNRFEEAMKWYDKAAVKHALNPDVHFNTGFLSMEMKDYEKAYEKFSLAVKVEPTYAKGYYYRGLVAETVGDLEKAIEDYQQALNLKPDYRLANEGLIRVQKTK